MQPFNRFASHPVTISGTQWCVQSSLRGPYQELHLVGVLLGLLVLDAPLLYLLREDVHREAGVDPARVLQQGLVHELVLALCARVEGRNKAQK